MIDLNFVERLMELLNRSNASAIEVKRNWWSTTLKISKVGDFSNAGHVTYQVAQSPPTATAAPAPQAPTVSPPPPATPPAEGAAPSATEEKGAAATQLLEIKSPMVGTFYARPEPGAEPYVRVGSRISPGQTLCIIEAMKIMNPIDAEIAGAIREIAVQDAAPVEFGQVLFRIDPNG